MGLMKCPRCELNYILDGGALCTVCREEVRGKRVTDDAIVLCSVCGEVPALPGDDMCKGCLKEIRFVDILSTDGEEDASVEPELAPEPVSSLDEIEAVDGLADDMDGIDDEEGEETDETEMDSGALDALEA